MRPGSRRLDLALLVASVVPFVYTLFDSSNGDLPLYHRYGSQLLGGTLPYRDWAFEYPPFALIWFVLPGATRGYTAFRAVFSLQVLALDVLAKVVLLHEGQRWARGGRLGQLGPFLAFSLLGVFQAYFYVKRLDAIAAALVVVALVAFVNERMATAGALLAVAAGTKLYPALAGPALLCLACQRGKALRLLAGAAAALAPVAVLSAFAPWWTFASLHTTRGLQAESTYGSVLWLLHFFGLTASWTSRAGCCQEIDGPVSRALLPVARVLFGVVTLGAVVTSVLSVWPRAGASTAEPTGEGRAPLSALVGRTILLPIVAFMISSVALSPQFAVWLIGPAALAVTRGRRASLVAIAVAVVLTTFVFPASGYFTTDGISLGRTLVLLARNVALLVALALLALEAAERRVKVGGG
jgi:hypothetical protein